MGEWEDVPDESTPLDKKQVQEHFINKGYEPHHAAGIAASLTQESNLDPNAVNPKSGAEGLAQWLGPRKVAFHNYAKATGGDPSDPIVQMDFVDHELNTTESKTKAKLLKTDTPANAAVVFSDGYERAGANEKNNARRKNLAEGMPIQSNWEDVPEEPKQPAIQNIPVEENVVQPEIPKESYMKGFLQSAGHKAMNDAANVLSILGQPHPLADKIKKLAGTIDESQPGTTSGKLLSDIVTTIPLSAETVLPNLLKGFGHGYATTEGDAGQRTEGGALGGVSQGLGAMIPGILGGAIGGFKPSKNAKYLMDKGVQPTVGQGIDQSGKIGSSIRQIEEASTSIPFLGGTARAARNRAETEWDKYILTKAEIPGKVSAGGAEGNAAIDNLGNDFSKQYNSQLQGHFIPLKPRLIADVTNTINDPNRYVIPEDRKWALDFIKSQFSAIPQMGSNFPADGMKLVESKIGAKARELNQHNPELSNILNDAESAIAKYRGDHLPPIVAQNLKQLDSKYAVYKRLEKASSYVGTDEGKFTPAHLLTASKALDKSFDKKNFARGKALMQDEASKGKSVLQRTLGESGTASRTIVGQASKANPAEIASAMASLPIYASTYGLLKAGATRPVQKALLGGYSFQAPAKKIIYKGIQPGGIAGYVLGENSKKKD